MRGVGELGEQKQMIPVAVAKGSVEQVTVTFVVDNTLMSVRRIGANMEGVVRKLSDAGELTEIKKAKVNVVPFDAEMADHG